MTTIGSHDPADTLKMLRETLCVAQTAINISPANWSETHNKRIQRLINDIDRQRPLGPDGKHDNRHTENCQCEDK
jgi:hypothetical protein